MIHTPFKSDDIAKQFNRDGFFVFDFLGEVELQYVTEIYKTLNGDDNKFSNTQFSGVNYSLATLDKTQNQRISDEIAAMISGKLRLHFSGFEILGLSFITKPANMQSGFFYHQDWAYTDEANHGFATCWIPLVDVGPNNGGMSLIKGSHHYFNTYRSDTIETARLPFEQIPEQLRTDICLKKGQCLAFHQAVFHGSYMNATNQSRPVLVFVVKPKTSPLLHYMQNGSKIDSFEMSVASFNKMLTQIPKVGMPDDAVLVSQVDDDNFMAGATDLIATHRMHSAGYQMFVNKDLQKEYIKNGFVKIDKIILAEVINELSELYKNEFSTQPGMYVTHTTPDMAKNKRIAKNIFELLAQPFSSVFTNYKTMLAHFAVKAAGGENTFNLHQDWSIVDEQAYAAAHVWIPLVDANEQNGTFGVVPKSHLLFHNYRSGSCGIRFTEIGFYKNQLKQFDAKAGDAIIYHPALFHGSQANKSDNVRIAVVAALCHKDANLMYYHKNGNEVHAYELLDVDLFGRLDALAQGEEPSGNILHKVPYHVLEIGNEELRNTLRHAEEGV